MTTAYTSLLGLALPVEGELSGTWGDVVNNSITQLLDDAVAGYSSQSVTGADWTLTTTGSGLPNQARSAILIPTGSPGVSRNIVAPSQSKAYIVINQSNAAVVLKGSATTGVTIPAGSTFLCAWNGSDFVKVSENVAGSNTQIQFNNNGVFGASANLTWDGTSLTASNYVSTGNITINTNKFTVAGATGNTVIAGTATINTLTSGRITFAGASGLLSDSSNLTWSGTTFAITGALTATTDSTFSSTGALTISKGTTGQQPGSPVTGMMRYNTTTNQFEGYSGSSPAWKSIGGSALSNDTTTASNLYPVFAAATTGTAENLYTSNALYLYKPSTGELSVKAPVASNGIFVNSTTVSSDYTIASGYNGHSIGPMTVNSGVTVTVASGQIWYVI